MIEHLHSATYPEMHVLGLVLNALGSYRPLMRLTADERHSDALPNLFCCQKSTLLLSPKKPIPWALETCWPKPACLWIAATWQVAAIQGQ